MLQHDVGTFSGLASKYTLTEFDAAASASSAAIEVMENALLSIDPTKIPTAFPNADAGAARAFCMTRGQGLGAVNELFNYLDLYFL
jgi:hypothetical protein